MEEIGNLADAKYLQDQLTTARKEINNLRQQIKSLRYVHEKDVESIKRLLRHYEEGVSSAASSVVPQNSSFGDNEPSVSRDEDVALKLKPIGIVSTWFPSKRGTPRQPAVCQKAPGKLTLFNSVFTNPEHALEGLKDFSHMWILFHFHRNDSTHIRAKVAPPRLNGIRTGVFSTRSPHRPCPIGLSLVKIVKIENRNIYFEGVDMVDQTPVLDVKPYIPQYDNPLHIAENVISLETSALELNNYENASSTGGPEGGGEGGGVALQESTDISQDEELALRLQAEEFEEEPLELRSLDRDVTYDLSTDLNTSRHHSRTLDTRSSDSEDLIDRFESLGRHSDVQANDEHIILRNSRLLDGADGPNTICSTDLDIGHRRSLNARLDNSPVRMGVREAPDGEEGLESQILTPSYTISNLQSISSNNLSEDLELHGNFIREDTSTSAAVLPEIRVPNWVSSNSHTTTLTVIFNDRAMIQLIEILKDKAEEKKRAIENVLREDPRSVYLRQRWGNQFYTFLIHDLHISCRFDDNHRIVTVFQVRHAGRTCECGEPEWQCLGHTPLP